MARGWWDIGQFQFSLLFALQRKENCVLCKVSHHFCPRDQIGAGGIRRSCCTSDLNASSSMSTTLRAAYTVPSVGSCLVGT